MDPILRSFETLVRRAPLAPLVLSARRRATVADIDALARAAARHLARSRGLVGLSAPNGPGFLASLIALRRAGSTALLLDALTPDAEVSRTVATLGAAAVLRCGTGWPAGPEDWTLTVPPALEKREPASLPGIAVVKVTSGSTGTPRGIATSAEALLADDSALASTMGLRNEEPVLATVPMSHSYGLSVLAIPALIRGVALTTPEWQTDLDPLLAAARLGAAVFPTVPAYVDALIRLAQPPDWPASVRLVIAAGAPLNPATAVRFRERFGVPVHVFYGASECGGICYDREGSAGERGTVGTPVEGVKVSLEGDGVVRVRSSACGAGYLPKDDGRLGHGSFLTSDLGEWRGGELALVGRADDVINIRGKLVSPGEVEAVLCEFPGVREAAVLGIARPSHPERLLRAVIACDPGKVTATELLTWCRQRLAPYKVPRSLVLVSELPRTPRGKLDRESLGGLAGTES